MKASIQTTSLLLLQAFVCCAVEQQYTLPAAKLTIKTVDEEGLPVSGVLVRIVFMDSATRRPTPKEGLTDNEGLFTSEGGSDSHVGGQIHKNGCYDGGFPFTPFRDAKDGRWQPWNATYTALMRKIENPVQVYSRRFRKLELPELQKPCGFDLEVGDWVAPHGKGRVSDFVFTGQRQYQNWEDFDVSVTLTFGNGLDGIQEARLPEEWRYSTFKWPRNAPEAGYEPNLLIRSWVKPGEPYKDTTTMAQAFFFRVRTVEKDGQIVSARYGKIKGWFKAEGRDTATVALALTYYLNPKSLDRNMEFDPKQNLIKGLRFDEQPHEP